MKLNELLDKTYDWKYTVNKKGQYHIADFKIADGSFVRVHIMIDFSGESSIAMVTFSRNFSHGLTGQGDAFKIFATVVDIVRDTVKLENPDVVAYMADKDERSRVSLYDKMTAKYKPDNYTKVNISDIKDSNLKQNVERWVEDTVDSEYAITLLVRS